MEAAQMLNYAAEKFKGNVSERFNCDNFTPGPAKIFTPLGSYGVTVFLMYAMPIITVFGIVGNIFSLIILKDSALRISGHFYLLCLCVCDSMSLILFLPTFWAVLVHRPYYLLFQSSPEPTYDWVGDYLMIWGVCQFRLFISFFFRTVSIWTIVLCSIERFIAVVFPMSSDRYISVKRSIISFSVTVVASALLSIPWFFSFDKMRPPCSGKVVCRGNDTLFINRFIEFLFLALIPAIIICVCNGTIIWTLKRRSALHSLYNKEAVLQQQRAVTYRLLAVSTAFVLLTFPSLVIISVHTANEIKEDTSHRRGILADIFHIAMFLFMVNQSINFVLYCLTGPTFRRAACALASCRLKQMRRYRETLLSGEGVSGGQGTDTSEVVRSETSRSETREALLQRRQGGGEPSTDVFPIAADRHDPGELEMDRVGPFRDSKTAIITRL